MPATSRRTGARAAALAVLLLVHPVRADDRLENPDFDGDAAGWPVGVWDPLDVDGAPDSGSLLLDNDQPGTSSWTHRRFP